MTPEEQAAVDAAQEKQLRDLASQITQMAKLGFDPMTVRKGVIAAVADTTTPPTVSINISGDTNTLVSQVRTLNNYTPLVGQTVLVGKQGSEIFLFGSIASVAPNGNPTNQQSTTGWIPLTPSTGSANGNSNGLIYYRRVLDHGSWKMQWQGGWNPSGNTSIVSTADALQPDYRPLSRRTILVARDASGSNDVKIDFGTDGTVSLVGTTTAPTISSTTINVNMGDYTDVRLSGYLSQGGSDLGHQHYWDGSDSSSHSHGGAAVVTAPSWVSLNGVEYFL